MNNKGKMSKKREFPSGANLLKISEITIANLFLNILIV
jgi:hypothetical protein